MLATLSGDLCLVAGLALLLLPLLAVQLSRPRDGVWGAVILLLGLVLVTSSDRLRGAPSGGRDPDGSRVAVAARSSSQE